MDTLQHTKAPPWIRWFELATAVELTKKKKKKNKVDAEKQPGWLVGSRLN